MVPKEQLIIKLIILLCMVCNFEWYHPVRAVRTGPTVYRYADRPLPDGPCYSATVRGNRLVSPGVPFETPWCTARYVGTGPYNTEPTSKHRYGTVLRTLLLCLLLFQASNIIEQSCFTHSLWSFYKSFI